MMKPMTFPVDMVSSPNLSHRTLAWIMVGRESIKQIGPEHPQGLIFRTLHGGSFIFALRSLGDQTAVDKTGDDRLCEI